MSEIIKLYIYYVHAGSERSLYHYVFIGPVPVAAPSKAWVSGRSLDGIAGSNSAGGMDVCVQ
jgi:hypothetical protein